jgi:electron transport complex protein RnfB
MMSENPYRTLAQQLDALPNGFPPAADGSDLRVLARLFTPEEAALAAQLRPVPELPADIAARLSPPPDVKALGQALKGLAKRGLIKVERVPGGLAYALRPYVVGFYEAQGQTLDPELAQLFEDYYKQGFNRALNYEPQVHRIVPVQRSIRGEAEVRPYESAAEIVEASQAWGVLDCICRKQKALIGEPCGHPIKMCMAFSNTPGAFDNAPAVQVQTKEEALATLREAADLGMVHSVSNNQEGVSYICNCCTCGCGILRGLVEVGVANVMARSAFVNVADADQCGACGTCVDRCVFGALTLDDVIHVDSVRCVGCGVCVPACPNDALGLVRRPEADALAITPPRTEADWMAARAAARGLPYEPAA